MSKHPSRQPGLIVSVEVKILSTVTVNATEQPKVLGRETCVHIRPATPDHAWLLQVSKEKKEMCPLFIQTNLKI